MSFPSDSECFAGYYTTDEDRHAELTAEDFTVIVHSVWSVETRAKTDHVDSTNKKIDEVPFFDV